MADDASPSRMEAEAAAAGACELRVLAGRSTGASAPIVLGQWVEIGHAFSNDVVLRDPGARGVRLRLRPQEGSAELDLIEGAVSFLGHEANAPAHVVLPAYAPLLLGESAIAMGAPGSPRWREADRLLAVSRGEAEAAPPDDEGAATPLPPWRVLSPVVAAMPRLEPVLPVAAGAAAAVLAFALVWTLAARVLSAAPTPAEASAALARDGFTTVQASAGTGGLVIRGALPQGRDLARLKLDIERRGWPAIVSVRTNDMLARTVADVLRTNGYDADVRPLGLGVVAATARGGDPTRLEALRRRVLAETPGLKQLVINGSVGGDATLLGADPSKKVVSVVGGDEGYVETADGSRYFIGAILPTGHTITAIGGRTVTVQKDGKATDLQF